MAWRNKPLGVCEHLGGIIIAASVEAKRWGIKTGTPVWEARKLYPKIILTKTNPDRYRYYTARFLKVFSDYTDYVEKYSIDEAFLDVTKVASLKSKVKSGKRKLDPFDEAAAIALEIKRRMKTEVGDYLTCSVGIAWNKLVAKIGSDMKKPDGLTVLRPQDSPWLYSHLKLTDIPGIAHRTEKNLRELGIRSLIDLKNYPPSKLVAHFGIMGYHLHKIGQLEGSWKENFDDTQPLKSIGHMYTLPQEYRNQGMLLPVLYKLSEMVAARLRDNSLVGKVLSAYINTADGEDFGKSIKLGYFINDGRDIFLESVKLLESILCHPELACPVEDRLVGTSTGDSGSRTKDSIPDPADVPIEIGTMAGRRVWNDNKISLGKLPVKLIGVTVGGLTNFIDQKSLFVKDEKNKRMVGALDKINEKYGDFTIARVPAHLARGIIRDSVGFGRMKEFKVNYHAGRKG